MWNSVGHARPRFTIRLNGMYRKLPFFACLFLLSLFVFRELLYRSLVEIQQKLMVNFS